MNRESRLLPLIDAFSAAPFEEQGWIEALDRLARATGSQTGQLMAFAPDGPAPLNWMADDELDRLAEFERAGGTDPDVNPRMRAGMAAPLLKVLTDDELVPPEVRRRSRFFAELLPRYDRPHFCAVGLVRQEKLIVGLSVLRTRRQGEISRVQRALFSAVAPHVRAAAQTQMALDHQGAQLIAGTLETMSTAAFVCDRHGRVRAMTPAAEALLDGGRPLWLKNGVLRAGTPSESAALAEAMARAVDGNPAGGPFVKPVVLARGLEQPLVLEVLSLPHRSYAFHFAPRALVVARVPSGDRARLPAMLKVVFGLTTSEAAVATELVTGHAPAEIASIRGASVATVRTQIQSIHAKIGVHHLSELIARLRPLE